MSNDGTPILRNTNASVRKVPRRLELFGILITVRQYTTKRTTFGVFALAFALICVAPGSIAAQSAEFLDRVDDSEAVSIGDVQYLLDILTMSVAPTTPFDAETYNDARPIRSDQLAALLADATAIPRGLGYRVIGLPRYALRDFRDARILPPARRRSPAGSAVAGEDALRIIARAAEAGVRETRSNPGWSLDGARSTPFFEWDLSLSGRGATDLDDEHEVESLSLISLRTFFSTQLESAVSIGADLTDDSQSIAVPEAAITAHLQPPAGGRGGTVIAGRSEVTDVTARLYDGPLDGIRIALYRGVVAGEVALGYTGMLAADDINTVYTAHDAENLEEQILGDGDRAAARYLANALLAFPEALGRQSPYGQLTVQLDEETISSDSKADRFDALYGTVGITGSLSTTQFYDSYVILGAGRYDTGDFGNNDRDTISWLAGGSWRWYPNGRLRPRVEIIYLAASGDDEERALGIGGGSGTFRGFIPAVGRTPWNAYDGLLTNVAYLGTKWSIRPIDPLLLEIEAAGIGRLSDGATGSDRLDAGADERLLGFELGGRVGIRPAYDLILELNGSIFLPVDSDSVGAYEPGTDPNGSVALEVTVQL